MDQEDAERRLEEFKAYITSPQSKGILIIHMALVMGVVLFGIVAIVVTAQKEAHEMLLLPAIASGMAFSNLIIASFVYKTGIAKINPGEDIQSLFGKIQGMQLVRMAMMEGAAIFGCVCILLGGKTPLYYGLSAFPIIAFLAAAIIWFPSQSNLIKVFTVNILKQPSLQYKR